jgi:hypothetical protein
VRAIASSRPSVGSEAELRGNLANWVKLDAPSRPLMVQSLGFLEAVKHFAGPLDYASVLMRRNPTTC